MATRTADDGLPALEVGPWVREKHERLKRYVTISASVRAKFTGPGNAGATYVELFSGPGRLLDRESGQFRPGSSLVAVEAATASRRPFSSIHINDLEPECVEANRKRLCQKGEGANLHCYTGTAEESARRIVASLNPYALHLVFLDPFNLGALPFSIIETFAALRRVDLLMHVSAMDLQRNLEQAVDAEEDHHFDIFAPGWRGVVDTRQAAHAVRRDLLHYWAGRVREIGLSVFEETQFELVSGSRNQPLYWLALASKEKKAGEFWEKIRHIQPQRGLDF